jgi:hypothetical protein
MIYYVIVAPFVIIILYMILFVSFKFLGFKSLPYEMFMNSPVLLTDNKIIATKSEHLKEYLISINPNMYKIKAPMVDDIFNKDLFIKNYTNSIIPVSENYLTMLDEYIRKCNKLLNKFPVFGRYKWEFMMSINNLEQNMPFTIDQYIILPSILLKSLHETYKHGHYKSDFINTLIHEKIHVIQRFNQEQFDNFYKTYYKHFLSRKYTDIIPESLQKRHMSNPDSNNSIWLYTIKNHTYLPLLIYENESFHSYGYNLENLSDIVNLDKYKYDLGYKYDVSFYHPNEVFACEMSGYIMSNMSSNICDKFIKNL